MVLRRITAVVKGKVTNKSKKEQFKRRLINAVCIFVLMGLTWAVGYLSVIEATSFVVQMLFCVFNSMQGYVIFMLYVVRRAEVRQVWSSVFRSTNTKNQSYLSSQSPQSSPRAKPRNLSNQPQTDSRFFTNSGDTTFAPYSNTFGPAPNVVINGSHSRAGARSRFSFAPETVPVSSVEGNRMYYGSVNGDPVTGNDLNDVLNINSDNEDFDISRFDEGIDNPIGPNVADPDSGGNRAARNTFENRYF